MEADQVDNLGNIVALFRPEKILLIIIGFILMGALVRFINVMSNKLQAQFNSKRLLVLQIVTVLNFFIYFAGTFFLLYVVLSPPKELLIALGGSVAVAIGFSIKDLVASFLAGIVLLFDRPFNVGDRVSFGDVYGEVQSIGLRAVRLVTLDDNLVTIPNSKFVTDAVASGNAGELDMMIVVAFYLDPSSDLRKVEEILKEIVLTSRYVYLKKPLAITFVEKRDFHGIYIEVNAKAYVFDTRYEKSFYSDVVLRANKFFIKNGIRKFGGIAEAFSSESSGQKKSKDAPAI